MLSHPRSIAHRSRVPSLRNCTESAWRMPFEAHSCTSDQKTIWTIEILEEDLARFGPPDRLCFQLVIWTTRSMPPKHLENWGDARSSRTAKESPERHRAGRPP